MLALQNFGGACGSIPWRLHLSLGRVHLEKRYRVGRGGFGRCRLQVALYLVSGSQAESVQISSTRANLVPNLEQQLSSDHVVVSHGGHGHQFLLVL